MLLSQFKISKHHSVLKHRYEHYLDIPGLKAQQQQKQQNFPFLEKQKTPEDFLELYRQIKQFHEKATATKREETYEKEIIKKELYSTFEESIKTFKREASKVMRVHNIDD
jgi:triphosphoribosyl-dephospho-CoA synthetase